ncbi:hypothetical protein TorRG33x02_198950 [Trema orientale]|uniref:Secreted protein n=1 Tax=Trema orientale TaxID=63057 RepID=A0A2P5EFL1_TREOI|nr:hypothetical protein TorRG33x02_198950 [Trema orientale]
MTWFLHLCLWMMLVAKGDTVRPTTIGYLVVRMRNFFTELALIETIFLELLCNHLKHRRTVMIGLHD